jgi:hypothetical protein
MARRFARSAALPSGLLLVACTAEPHNTAMQGNANGVIINYVGDIKDTLPIARQHCARYERVPVLMKTDDENATYACVQRPTGS